MVTKTPTAPSPDPSFVAVGEMTEIERYTFQWDEIGRTYIFPLGVRGRGYIFENAIWRRKFATYHKYAAWLNYFFVGAMLYYSSDLHTTIALFFLMLITYHTIKWLVARKFSTGAVATPIRSSKNARIYVGWQTAGALFVSVVICGLLLISTIALANWSGTWVAILLVTCVIIVLAQAAWVLGVRHAIYN